MLVSFNYLKGNISSVIHSLSPILPPFRLWVKHFCAVLLSVMPIFSLKKNIDKNHVYLWVYEIYLGQTFRCLLKGHKPNIFYFSFSSSNKIILLNLFITKKRKTIFRHHSSISDVDAYL